jgi:hypothetical protein
MMFDFRSANSIRDAARRTRYRSAVLFALLVGIAVFFVACHWEENIEGTIENRTDSAQCFHYDYAENAPAGGCSFELKPHTSADWFFECGDGPGTEKARVAVLLTVKEGGRLVYQRTEECRVWQASGGKFVIEQRGDDFIVTDYIAATTPSRVLKKRIDCERRSS